MHSRRLAGLVVGAMFITSAALAQTPPSNPMDAIPEQPPFNVPYGAPISAERAQSVIVAAVAEAIKRGWPMNISVMDSGGNLVAFQRMDGSQLASISLSQHKARTAAKYRRETKAFEAGVQNGATYLMTLDDVIASRGGIPLVENGKLIGAIGVSGGTGSQDETVAKAGAALIK